MRCQKIYDMCAYLVRISVFLEVIVLILIIIIIMIKVNSYFKNRIWYTGIVL